MKANPVLTITRKRDGRELSETELRSFIDGAVAGEVPDYQVAAFLMAVYFKGMTFDETVTLTRAMLESGARLDLSKVPGPKVDKHSTGGVGDKVSLILAPLAAACGLKVPMMAGRGLSYSGGTLDKLEAIPGFEVRLSEERFVQALEKVGCAIIGQSERIAPADRKFYALRDVTGTVECFPLIVASILSKKLAEGANALIMDIKVGSGAFMKTREQARKLARTLIQVAGRLGLPCRAVLTDMSQPLGSAVGNSLEVIECISVLRDGKGAQGATGDLKELSIQLCARMLEVAKVTRNLAEGRKLAHARLGDGSAWERFQRMVKVQGGSLAAVLDPKRLPAARSTTTWVAPRQGYLTRINTEAIGRILVDLGGGRLRAEDPIDPGVGLLFHRKLGARVQSGEPLVTVHYSDASRLEELRQHFLESIEIGAARKPVPKLILESL